MLITVGLTFNTIDVEAAIELLKKVSEPLKPEYFGDRERKKNKENKLVNEEKFNNFKKCNPLGFFLFSKACTFDITVNNGKISTIFVDIEDDRYHIESVSILCAFSNVPPLFGFSCSRDEYKYRNRHYIEIGENIIESWVGRDLRKYIPGLYWHTMLSENVLTKHGLSIDSLSFEANTCETLGNKSAHLLRFFNHPRDWREHAERLDSLCYRTKGVFSKQSVEAAVAGVRSFMEYDHIISQWR